MNLKVHSTEEKGILLGGMDPVLLEVDTFIHHPEIKYPFGHFFCHFPICISKAKILPAIVVIFYMAVFNRKLFTVCKHDFHLNGVQR